MKSLIDGETNINKQIEEVRTLIIKYEKQIANACNQLDQISISQLAVEQVVDELEAMNIKLKHLKVEENRLVNKLHI